MSQDMRIVLEVKGDGFEQIKDTYKERGKMFLERFLGFHKICIQCPDMRYIIISAGTGWMWN